MNKLVKMILVIALAMVVVIAVVSCNNNKETTSETTTIATETQQTTSATTKATTVETTTEETTTVETTTEETTTVETTTQETTTVETTTEATTVQTTTEATTVQTTTETIVTETTVTETTATETTVTETTVTEITVTETTATETTVTEVTTTETTTEATTETETVQELKELEPIEYHDPKAYDVGSYVKLVYNEEFCDVQTEVKKGLGTRETVTITVTMKNGYRFDGFTKGTPDKNGVTYGALIDNVLYDSTTGEILTTESTYSFTATEAVTIYLNYSVKVVYHANGGTVVSTYGSGDEYVDYYPLSYFKCPVALKAGYFTREGYVLSEYAFTSDGSGDRVSLGSRFKANSSVVDVYCVWEEATSKSDLKYTTSGNNVTITGYTGSNPTVVIPETIDGKTVTQINANALKSDVITRVVLPRTITTVASRAISGPNVKEVVLHDSITSMKDDSVSSSSFKTLRINTTMESFWEWSRSAYNKMDRLVWAKDLRKIVIYGGSGSWYGWDSEVLTQEFGDKYVIINMGMNANMCSAAYIEGISAYMNEDDILLWAPEPGPSVLGDTNFDYGQRTWWFTFSHFDMYKNIDISEYTNVLSTFASFNSTHASKQYPVKRAEMSGSIYGDSLSNRPNQRDSNTYNFDYFDWYDYTHMGEVIDALNEKGVRVLFTYPAMAENMPGTSEPSGMESYKANILKNFDVEIISDYMTCLYPITMFWNSEWHMTNEGATARSISVAADLKVFFAANYK